MAQELQLLKYEITSALDFLSLDSLRLLAKFVTFLRTNMAQAEITQLESAIQVNTPNKTVQITSPRLAHRHQIIDFKKESDEDIFNSSLITQNS